MTLAALLAYLSLLYLMTVSSGFLFPSYTAKTAPATLPQDTVLRVVDGDTVIISAPYLPSPLKSELALRITGVDTPEKSYLADCEDEKQRGLAAHEFTRKLVTKAKVTRTVLTNWDKYGGRVLGELYLDGVSLAQSLIAASHAKAYNGGKKASWC